MGFPGVVVAPDGSFYLAGQERNAVWRQSDGQFVRIAGSGSKTGHGYNGDGMPAMQALLHTPNDVALDKEGRVYIADTQNQRVRRIELDGTISTYAGNGELGGSGDGGPATEAQIGRPHNVEIGPDGTLFISAIHDLSGNRSSIRRVTTDGTISTFYTPPLSYGKSVRIDSIAVGPEGSLYVALRRALAPPTERENSVFRILPDGNIMDVAGDGTIGFSGDGGSATEAQLGGWLGALAIGPDGSVYIGDSQNYRVRRVGPDGIIATVAGCGDQTASCDDNSNLYGGLAASTFVIPQVLAVDPDGALYAGWAYILLKMETPFPGLGDGQTLLPDRSGSLAYIFAEGLHRQTRNALTDAALYDFTYDGSGRLIFIQDGDGKITAVERDAAGSATAIVGPYGQRTTLSLDANSYLSAVTNPASEKWQFAYTGEGLLTSGTNPNGGTSTYTYTPFGQLVEAVDAAGNSQTLDRTDMEDGYEVTRTTAMGRVASYRTQSLPTREKRTTAIFPDGLENQAFTATDGVTTMTTPDGMSSVHTRDPDARFGMQSSFLDSLKLHTPGGVAYESRRSQAVSLFNPSQPLGVQNLTDLLEINGRTYSNVFEGSTSQFTTTTPMGRETLTKVDSLGRAVERQVEGLHPVSFEYDTAGRLKRIVKGTDLVAREYSFSYGSDGYLSQIEDPLSRIFAMFYDDAGRLTSYVLPDGRTLRYSYDALGNMTSVTPPDRPGHQFAYNAVNLQVAFQPPGTGDGTPEFCCYSTGNIHLRLRLH
jgi:YD repeat-containing protein